MVIDTTFSEFFFPDDFWFSDCFGDSHDKKVIWPSERIQFCRWKKAIWSFLISSFSFLVLRSVHGRPHFSLTKEDELFICRPCFCMTPPGKSRLGLSCRRPSRRWSPEVDVLSWGLVQMAGPCGVSGVGGDQYYLGPEGGYSGAKGTNRIWVSGWLCSLWLCCSMFWSIFWVMTLFRHHLLGLHLLAVGL